MTHGPDASSESSVIWAQDISRYFIMFHLFMNFDLTGHFLAKGPPSTAPTHWPGPQTAMVQAGSEKSLEFEGKHSEYVRALVIC